MAYSDFLINKNIFNQGYFLSSYSKKSTQTSLDFLKIFEQSEVRTTIVQSKNKIPERNFPPQSCKERSLILVYWNIAQLYKCNASRSAQQV